MENETNIISDDDFLKEILGNVDNEQTTATVEDQKEIEKILNNEVGASEETQEGVPDGENNQQAAEAVVEEIEEKSKRFNVKDSVLTLIENGVWTDMPIKYGDKEYENIEDLIEKEKPSKELFQLLSQAQNKHREDLINDQYVKVGDKNSTKAKLVDAIIHDIDYSDLLEYHEEIIKPLQQVDFSTMQNGERAAEAFVKQCLVEIDGYHPDSVDIVVEKLKKDYRLLEKAEDYQTITIDKYNREIEKRTIEKRDEIVKEKELMKEDMKNLRSEVKNLNVDDAFASKILKVRYSKDESGKYHYEQLIQDKIKDKAFEAKLMYFILNDEDYVENRKSRIKTDTQKKYLELVNITPTTTGGKQSKSTNNLQADEDEIFRELGLLD